LSPKSCPARSRDHHRHKLRRKTILPEEKQVDLEELHRDLEVLVQLALNRSQLEAVARWMAEVVQRTLRHGDDDDRQ